MTTTGIYDQQGQEKDAVIDAKTAALPSISRS